MKKDILHDDRKKDLEIIMSRINGLEVSATDEYQIAVVSVLKILVQGKLTPLIFLPKMTNSSAGCPMLVVKKIPFLQYIQCGNLIPPNACI